MRRPIWLPEDAAPEALPPVAQALDDPDGLLAVGGALTPAWLLYAYRHGVFPWYSPGQPILWWSPDPRTVLFPQEFRCSRSLAQSIRNRGYETRIDTAFATVINACAAPRATDSGTWITREMRAAYVQLHCQGAAHSVETWSGDCLVGGLYGVTIGRVFYGESMFTRSRDASKVALARLVDECRRRDVRLIDCQMATEHLFSLGSRTLPRARFVRLLEDWADPSLQLWRDSDG